MNRTGQKCDAVPANLIAKVLAGHTDPGGAGRTMRGIKRQNRDGSGQLLQGQQGKPLEFLGCDRWFKSKKTCDIIKPKKI